VVDRKTLGRFRNLGLDPFFCAMSHELGHALGNAAIGRKCTVKIQPNDFGHCVFPLMATTIHSTKPSWRRSAPPLKLFRFGWQ